MGKQELPFIVLDRSCEEGSLAPSPASGRPRLCRGGALQKGGKMGFYITALVFCRMSSLGLQWVSPLGQPVLFLWAGLGRQ